MNPQADPAFLAWLRHPGTINAVAHMLATPTWEEERPAWHAEIPEEAPGQIAQRLFDFAVGTSTPSRNLKEYKALLQALYQMFLTNREMSALVGLEKHLH